MRASKCLLAGLTLVALGLAGCGAGSATNPDDDDDGQGTVTVRVIDHGRGVPPERANDIFQRFHQVDASDSRDKGGTGLGLAICKSIVNEHGGRIWMETTPGGGATCAFTLPVSQTAAEPVGRR